MYQNFCEWTLAIEVTTLRYKRRLELWMSIQQYNGRMIRREKETLVESEFKLTPVQFEELWLRTVQSGILERKLDTQPEFSPEDVDFYITLTCDDSRRTVAWTSICEFVGARGPDGEGIMALVYALQGVAGLPRQL